MKQADVKDLSTLCKRVEHWREHREGARSRIPEELWEAAVGVALVEGVYPTCRALRFDYARLKERVEQAESKARGRGTATAFVELDAGHLGGSGQTVVEFVGRRGGRVRIDVSGTSRVDVVGLAQAFWSHES